MEPHILPPTGHRHPLQSLDPVMPRPPRTVTLSECEGSMCEALATQSRADNTLSSTNLRPAIVGRERPRVDHGSAPAQQVSTAIRAKSRKISPENPMESTILELPNYRITDDAITQRPPTQANPRRDRLHVGPVYTETTSGHGHTSLTHTDLARLPYGRPSQPRKPTPPWKTGWRVVFPQGAARNHSHHSQGSTSC